VAAGSNGYRLPTEAQWEYAARGGNGSPGNFIYSGSNTLNNVAWNPGNSSRKTHEVGKKPANGLGLYDMSGNVWERVWDWYAVNYSYTGNNLPDPSGAPTGTARIYRGGGHSSSAYLLTFRISDAPTVRHEAIGFRLVRPAQ